MTPIDLPKVACVQAAPIQVTISNAPATASYCKRYRYFFRTGEVYDMVIRKGEVKVKQRRKGNR